MKAISVNFAEILIITLQQFMHKMTELCRKNNKENTNCARFALESDEELKNEYISPTFFVDGDTAVATNDQQYIVVTLQQQ